MRQQENGFNITLILFVILVNRWTARGGFL
jgi:hypothetical protein